jgi:TonB-dependent receptor
VKPSFIARLSALLLILLVPTALFASGTIRGAVVDSLTKDALAGAHVSIVGTALGASSDIDGNYAIRSIPAGKYTVRFSYIGYITKDAHVTVTDEGTVTLNVGIVVSAVQGQEIVITGQAQGQVAAINQQLNSNKIVNVISEQKIKELPDANAAEALGRLPGVSVTRSGGEANKIILRGLSEALTTITVDGVQLSATDADSRGIDLSTIAQGSLSGIVLTKAITSDMDGQAIAGNVNFVTKTAPEERSVQVTAQGMYSRLDDIYGQYNVYGNYGERFFDGLIGVQVFGNAEKRNRSSEAWNVSIDQLSNKNSWQGTNFNVSYTPEQRKRYGGKVILDVRTPDNGVVKFSADVNRTERRLSIISRDYPTTGETGYHFTGQDFNTNMLSFGLQGQNHVSDFQIDWTLSFTQSETDNPYDFQQNFLEPSLLTNGQVSSGMRLIPTTLRQGPWEAYIPYAVNNFKAASLQYGYIRTLNSIDFQRTALLDVRKDYLAFDLAGQLQFGGKYVAHYHRRYSSSYFSPYYNGVQFKTSMKLADGSIVPKPFAQYGFANLQQDQGLVFSTNFINPGFRDVFNRYALAPMFNADILRNWYALAKDGVDPNNGNAEYSFNTQESGTDYGAMEAVGAAYVMNTLNIGTDATLITGLRAEVDNDDYHAFYSPTVLTFWSNFRDTSATHREAILLPNAHLILKPTDFMNIRLAAYKGINRPDFNLRLPTYVMVGIASYVDQPQLHVGNTNLKNATAWNYELNLQFYGEAIGLLSVSGFYKAIDNQVEYMNNFGVGPTSTLADSMGVKYINGQRPFKSGTDYMTYSLYMPYNSPKTTKVWGFEAEQQVNFRYLPGLLSGLTVSYNFSFIKNETYVPLAKIVYDTVKVGIFKVAKPRVVLAELKSRIVNAPEFFCNVVVGYDFMGFSTRLSYFRQGEFYNSLSNDGRGNILQRAFERLDLSLKQSIGDNLAVGLNVNNLTNTYEGTVLENSVVGYRVGLNAYRYGTTADLWVRVSL